MRINLHPMLFQTPRRKAVCIRYSDFYGVVVKSGGDVGEMRYCLSAKPRESISMLDALNIFSDKLSNGLAYNDNKQCVVVSQAK